MTCSSILGAAGKQLDCRVRRDHRLTRNPCGRRLNTGPPAPVEKWTTLAWGRCCPTGPGPSLGYVIEPGRKACGRRGAVGRDQAAVLRGEAVEARDPQADWGASRHGHPCGRRQDAAEVC